MTGFSEEPAAPYGARLDKASFFAWVQGQEHGRYELKDGHIVMHPGNREHHGRISYRLAAAFISQLDPDAWLVTGGDFAVEIGENIRYPDLVVCRPSPKGNPLSAREPVLLGEVLSPSSLARDMVEKLAEYTSLSSLECYIVASQDEPIVWVWQRDPETREFPKLPTEIQGREAAIQVTSLAITLPLADIYRGIGTT